ncbi:MAG TPA: SIS domain-containing protein [Acidimicrobiales bacterium]|nr:SIS domain-containing protein [Acidimicrobiales bacterium]
MTHPQYLDTLGLWEATAGLPEQMEVARATSAAVLADARLPDPGDIHAVAVLGVGAGGQAGDAAAAYGAGHSSVPIVVAKGYEVPAFVDAHTLVFAVSASGDAEETRSAAEAALGQGAPVVVVAGGGALGSLAQSEGLPNFSVPGDLPVGRASLGALTVPLLMTLAHLGIVPDVDGSLSAAEGGLHRRRDALMAATGPAEEVARLIGRTIPLVYGSTGLSSVAAERWKTQVNENAKTPAFFAEQPDLSHNEVAGWGQHGDVTRQVLSLITLRHAGEHPRVTRRFALVIAATDEVMANVIPVWAEGDDDLGRFFDLAFFGDFVSLHLAGREGIDPGPEPAVGDVRAGLS